jgi:hypothetical protein
LSYGCLSVVLRGKFHDLATTECFTPLAAFGHHFLQVLPLSQKSHPCFALSPPSLEHRTNSLTDFLFPLPDQDKYFNPSDSANPPHRSALGV